MRIIGENLTVLLAAFASEVPSSRGTRAEYPMYSKMLQLEIYVAFTSFHFNQSKAL
jgi:hypothetical protein